MRYWTRCTRTPPRARRRATASCSTCSWRHAGAPRSRTRPTSCAGTSSSCSASMAGPAEDYRPGRMLGLMARSLILPTAAPVGAGVPAEPAGGISVTFVGHATVLVRFDGVALLTDPVYSSRLILPKRLVEPGVPLAGLPPLDVVLVSHRDGTVFFPGDTAYFPGFRDYGRRWAIDVALLPIGAYRPPAFRRVHMNPEDALQTLVDLDARHMVPIHWGTFVVSYEPIDEPVGWLEELAGERGLTERVAVLRHGESRRFGARGVTAAVPAP